MANSSDVSAGDDILASQYNNLRADVLNTSTGHTHNGTDAKSIAVDGTTLEISSGVPGIKDGGVGASKLGTGATFNGTVTRYYTIGAGDFSGVDKDDDIQKNGWLRPKTAGATIHTYCSLHLPNSAIITSVKAYWYCDDALASSDAKMRVRVLSDGTTGTMADFDHNSTAGYHSVEDTSISPATIDNTTNAYNISVDMTSNNSTIDIYLLGIVITYTVTVPLP